MPKTLSQGVLYVSYEFQTAAHLCACGCGSKIRTPLGPTEWKITEHDDGPSLWPSIGNWQLPCRSHYIVDHGKVSWAESWSDAQVLAGRRREQRVRDAHYKALEKNRKKPRSWWRWITSLFE